MIVGEDRTLLDPKSPSPLLLVIHLSNLGIDSTIQAYSPGDTDNKRKIV